MACRPCDDRGKQRCQRGDEEKDARCEQRNRDDDARDGAAQNRYRCDRERAKDQIKQRLSEEPRERPAKVGCATPAINALRTMPFIVANSIAMMRARITG
ncbi:hypothetical protein ASG67_15640 [Sphingomonas sp. Leaf339]|nr:hypothetical protein ASG67_15640 [Sphingomonas sp. Leaf339]